MGVYIMATFLKLFLFYTEIPKTMEVMFFVLIERHVQYRIFRFPFWLYEILEQEMFMRIIFEKMTTKNKKYSLLKICKAHSIKLREKSLAYSYLSFFMSY